MVACPNADTFLRLLDGQLSEERAGDLRAHAATCQACAKRLSKGTAMVEGLARPVGDVDADTKHRLLQRIAETPQVAAAMPALPRWLPIGLAAFGAVAAVVAVPLLRQGATSGFTARGGNTPPSIQRDVGVDLYAGENPVGLNPGDDLKSNAPLTTTYVNLGKSSAYLLSVAIDSAGRVHWLQPGAGAVAPVELRPATSLGVLPETVVLDSPALGSLRILTIVTPTAVQLSALPPFKLRPSVASLAAKLPGASISELFVNVVP